MARPLHLLPLPLLLCLSSLVLATPSLFAGEQPAREGDPHHSPEQRSAGGTRAPLRKVLGSRRLHERPHQRIYGPVRPRRPFGARPDPRHPDSARHSIGERERDASTPEEVPAAATRRNLRRFRAAKRSSTTAPVQGEDAEELAAGECGEDPIPAQTTVWPRVSVSLPVLRRVSGFGWVQTQGFGVRSAGVLRRTCFTVAARNWRGQSMDNGTTQRALFTAKITSTADPGRPIVARASVMYLPAWSLHCVCYVAPTAEQYLLQLELGYVNAYDIEDTATNSSLPDDSCNWGFANYSTVLSSQLVVTDLGLGPDYATLLYRTEYPVCDASILGGAASSGFWQGHKWFPYSCRLTRVTPASVLGCLDGKSVLVMGDSQSRILSGFLQRFLKFQSRSDAIDAMLPRPTFLGDILGSDKSIPTGEIGAPPPLDNSTGQAVQMQYEFLGANTTYYGGIYQGFFSRQVDTVYYVENVAQQSRFSLAYSSNFKTKLPLFEEWKTTGNLSDGVTVFSGGVPFDMVVHANQIHDSMNYTPAEYEDVLVSGYLEALKQLVVDPGSLLLVGSTALVEFRNWAKLCRMNPLRKDAFDTAALSALQAQGFPNYLSMTPLTFGRTDFAFDSLHYTWPVSLAVVDVWLGSVCPDPSLAE